MPPLTFARQDLETHFIGLLGEDPAAQAVLAELDKESVHTDGVVSSAKYTTSYSVILLAPSGERTILNYHGEPLSSQPDLVDEANIKGDWLYVSSVGSMSLLRQIMERAKKNNLKGCF
jgi:sugar/nucleoside kinase (ribokinase family)